LKEKERKTKQNKKTYLLVVVLEPPMFLVLDERHVMTTCHGITSGNIQEKEEEQKRNQHIIRMNA
jgi:hypothetical protein